MPLLELKEVNKNFGGLKAVSQVSFELNGGEILGIIGPNGAGKTTLFNVITGFLKPDSGEVWFNGEKTVGLKPHQVCKKGMVRTFQLVKPFIELTVLENVVVAALNRAKTIKEAREKALRTIELVGLKEKTNTLSSGLTLGHRKRLELARTLATEPKLLLLDEVMAGLTPTEVDELIRLLKEVNHRGVTILLIEHVMRGLMALSRRVVVLNYGQKIAEGVPGEVVKNRQVIEAYLGEEFAGAQG
ncbi:MAG: ABC transporter ATP-binding protein [Deltaproteobacteria bacterium]|nr:ABC transporter ATP-binding protein [Deltaproteobacteria bacterium]MBS3920179.1 ABC transporter ATP-binding protein [Deltaproteobacteria bacterium]